MFDYEIEDNEVTITGVKGASVKSIIIPEFIDGYPVTKINEYCFWFTKSLDDITIPDSVFNIDYNAFHCCDLYNINGKQTKNCICIINDRFIYHNNNIIKIMHNISNDYCGYKIGKHIYSVSLSYYINGECYDSKFNRVLMF